LLLTIYLWVLETINGFNQKLMVAFDTVRWNNDTIHGWFKTVRGNVAIILFATDTVHTDRYHIHSCEVVVEN